MTMKIKKITYAVFMLLPLAVAAVALLFLPEQIPAHYGAGMTVDNAAAIPLRRIAAHRR